MVILLSNLLHSSVRVARVDAERAPLLQHYSRDRGRRRKGSLLLHCSRCRAGVERLPCYTVATVEAGVKVSHAVTSSHCSSMAAVLGLDR